MNKNVNKRQIALAGSLFVALLILIGLMLMRPWAADVVPESGLESTGEFAPGMAGASPKPKENPQPRPERLEGVAAAPVDTAEFVATFPFRWLSPPDVLPDSGIPIRLHQHGGEPVEGEPCLIVGDVLAVREELPDGRYLFIARDDVLFRPQSWMEVSGGEYRLLSTPYEVDGQPAVGTYFLVPVTLRVEVLGAVAEAKAPEIVVGANPDGIDGDTFHLRVSSPDGVSTPLWLPRSPLRVGTFRGPSYESRAPEHNWFRIKSCSLMSEAPSGRNNWAEARAPARDEVIHIVLEAYTMLTVNLVEQNPGDLSKLLETPQFKLFQEKPELKGDGPDDEWVLRARFQGLGAEFRHYTTVAYDRIRTGRLSSGGTVFTTTVMIPPLREDREIGVDISARYNVPVKRTDEAGFDLAMLGLGIGADIPSVTKFVGTGSTVLRAVDTSPSIDVVVAQQVDWTLTLEVVDTAGAPRPDLPFRIEGRFVRLAHSLPRLSTGESITNQEGQLILHAQPTVSKINVRIQLVGWEIPLELNPEIGSSWRFSVTYDPAVDHEDSRVVRMIVPVDFVQPLVLRVDLSRLSEEQREIVLGDETAGVRRPVTVSYQLLPHSYNQGFDSDEGNVRLDDELRAVTRLRSPGRYSVVLISPFFGEYIMDIRHRGQPGDEVVVTLEPFAEVVAEVRDDEGEPLAGTVVITSDIDHVLAWSLGQFEVSPFFTPRLRLQTASRAGLVKFICRESRLDPRKWLLFHADHGLFRAAEVSGSADEGFVLRGVDKPPSGELTVEFGGAFRREDGYEYQVSVTPIYSRGDANRASLIVGMGQTKVADANTATFDGLPPGRYMVTVTARKGDRIYRPSSGDNTSEVEIIAGEMVSVRLLR